MQRNFSLPDIKAGIIESSFLNTTAAGTSSKSSAKGPGHKIDISDKNNQSSYYFLTNTPSGFQIPPMPNIKEIHTLKNSPSPYQNNKMNQNQFNFGHFNYKIEETPQKFNYKPLMGVQFKEIKTSSPYLRQSQQDQYMTQVQQKIKDESQAQQDDQTDDEAHPLFTPKRKIKFINKDSTLERKRTPGYIGVDSLQYFQRKFQRLEKELELPENYNSATTAYLSEVKNQQLLPQPLGLISIKGKDNQVRSYNKRIGKNYAICLSKSMRHLLNTQIVDLPGNRLGQKGGEAILSSLAYGIRTLNLDNNQIGPDALCTLVKWIEQQNTGCQLEELSLQGNNIDDTLCVPLCETLTKYLPPLRELNLSKNNIGDKGACSIADFLLNQYQLKTLRISWNKIQGRGAIAIAIALKECQKLSFFDGSFNMFGNKRNGEFGLKMGETVNKGFLKHLDISYNSMDKDECAIFGKTIIDNHTLWGLHMLGNECVVDSMNFIRPGLRQIIQSRDILYSPVKEPSGALYSKKNLKQAKITSYQKCWICEGWSERKFEWVIGKSGDHAKFPAYIHFDFDEYMPWLLHMDEQNNSYFIWKMIPPGQSNYFYSFGGEHGIAEVARDQHHMKTFNVKHFKDILFKELDGKTMREINFTTSFELKSLNYIIASQSRVLDNEYNPVQFQAIVPRMQDAYYIRPFTIRPITPWSRPMSLFRDFQIETEEMTTECFGNDIKAMKVPKMTEEEKEEFLVEVRNAYWLLKETYKYLASNGANRQIFSVQLNIYTDFVKQIGILDGKIINTSLSDTEFYSINRRTQVSKVNPGTALVRFQFIEIMIRLAIKRYFTSGETKSRAEAVKMMFEKNLLPRYGHLDPQKWREDRYWNEEIDNLFKSHFPIFEIIFRTYGCHYLLPSEKPFMMVDEFESFIYSAGIVNENFGSREASVCLNRAMMTSTDELNNDKHLKATFGEFLEAFARVCEKLSVAPPYDENVILSMSKHVQSEDPPMTQQERFEQQLYKKIENVLPNIVKNCMTEKFQDKWKWPKRDMESVKRNKKDPDALADFGISSIQASGKTIFEM